MRTAEQVEEIIRRMPPNEREKLSRQLALEVSNEDDDQKRAGQMRALLGSIDVGRFSDPTLDRETC
jgi:hypothetical protein